MMKKEISHCDILPTQMTFNGVVRPEGSSTSLFLQASQLAAGGPDVSR